MNRTVAIQRFEDGIAHGAADIAAVEEPLEIRLRYRTGARWTTQALGVTMRTPGRDRELATGLLFSEGIIETGTDLTLIETSGTAPNELTVELAPGVEVDWARLKRNFYTTSSCGVCGKASLQALETQGCEAVAADFAVAPAVLETLPAGLRGAQPTFAATGGLHAAGLFTPAGELLAAHEDVGRHNAVDKLTGQWLLEGTPEPSACVLALSGRASFELLQKAVRARVGVVAAIGAPSSLAVELADRFGITLIGFLRERRFNVYSHPQRIAVTEAPPVSPGSGRS